MFTFGFKIQGRTDFDVTQDSGSGSKWSPFLSDWNNISSFIRILIQYVSRFKFGFTLQIQNTRGFCAQLKKEKLTYSNNNPINFPIRLKIFQKFVGFSFFFWWSSSKNSTFKELENKATKTLVRPDSIGRLTKRDQLQ